MTAWHAPALALTARLSTGQTVTVNSTAQLQTTTRALIASGLTDDARRLARAYSPGDADYAFRVAYVDAQAASAEGRDADAVRIYRAILAQRPDLDLVRIAMTGALARLNMHDTARAQAERLIAAGVDDQLGGQISGLLRSLDQKRPLSFRGYVSFLPSSNINGGTDRTTVSIGPVIGAIPANQQRQSGIGLALGGQLAYRAEVGTQSALITALDAKVEHFPSIKRTNLSGQLSFGLEHRLNRGTALTRALLGGATVDGNRTYSYSGLSFETNTRLGDRWRLYLGPEYRYERYDLVPGDNGHFLTLPVQLDRFGGPDTFVRFIAGASFGRKAQARFSFDEAKLGLGYYKEFSAGFTTYIEATAAVRTYKDLYPGLTVPRKDRRFDIGLTVTKRDLVVAGFAPQVSVSYQRNQSNAAFNDTSRGLVDVRLTREF
ncbi:surface lipoprotein assembly modifier [Pseudooceanicola sp. MF1-13]|uniref:surface lipoprotein assembly modifier n=1 Tax=Pseudooceanicola sp. MF1-13 TaxID=3379095 RepID=UPI003891E579